MKKLRSLRRGYSRSAKIALAFFGSAIIISTMLVSVQAVAPAQVVTSPSASVHLIGSCAANDKTVPAGSSRVLNIVYTAINDEDSGNNNWWALDHLVEHVQVWLTPTGSWYFFQTFSGPFVTPTGVGSPGAGTAEPESAFGNTVGNASGTFTASFTPGNRPISGNIGIVNMKGTTQDVINNVLDSSSNSSFWWVTNYFGISSGGSVVSGFAFAYTLNGALKPAPGTFWCNTAAGNSGDILT